MPLTDREKGLFALARKRINEGSLPDAVPEVVWAGPGSREACSLCGSTIEPEQAEYELSDYDGVRFRFHLRCHAIWQLAATESIKGA